MPNLDRVITHFLSNDPIRGAAALRTLVELGERAEEELFSRPIGYPATVQILRRWLRYVASRSETVAPRLLDRLENPKKFNDGYAIACLFAGLEDSDGPRNVLDVLGAQIAAGFAGRFPTSATMADYDPVAYRLMAWGYAGGRPTRLWDYASNDEFSWEKLRTFAFRAACVSVARASGPYDNGHWALEQLLTHRWGRDSSTIQELQNSDEVPNDAIDRGEAWLQAFRIFGAWRRGEVADEVLYRWSSHEHWRPREFGAQILAALAFKRTVGPCVAWLQTESIPSVRGWLLSALAGSETVSGANALIRHYSSTGGEGRPYVAKAAWLASDKNKAIDVLVSIADREDPHDPHAGEALVSLARLGHRHTSLFHMLDSPDHYVRANAALATAYLHDSKEHGRILSMGGEASRPTERLLLAAALAILGHREGSAKLHEELVSTVVDADTDIFYMNKPLQSAIIDGLRAGGSESITWLDAWQAELKPLDRVAIRIDLEVPVTRGWLADSATPTEIGDTGATVQPTVATERTSEGTNVIGSSRSEDALKQRSDPKILIVTALYKELAAVRATLDEEERPSGAPGDPNIYIVGSYRTGGIPGRVRRVRIATQPAMGMNNASTLGADALRSFPRIEHIFMVGIAGGCPNPARPEEHVRLGDVVVSGNDGIVEYDYVKRTRAGDELRSHPQRPSRQLLQAQSILAAGVLGGERPWEALIARALQKSGIDKNFARPDETLDVLYDEDTKIGHPTDFSRYPSQPRIFEGAIGAANKLLKDPAERDWLRDHLKVRAIEMEASGLQTAAWAHGKDIMVVRGICDYCDKWKSDLWQNYAALAAAAYVRALIEILPDEWFT